MSILSSNDPEVLDPLSSRAEGYGAEATTDAARGRTRVRRHGRVTFWLAVAFLAVVALLAVFADWLPFVHSYEQQDILASKEAPSAAHWMGTDKLGRDIFSRVAYGAR